uniref:BZIP domain-containing protein n=1 Tax=Globodera pallida TaxID=36090 RepID=A0A183BVY0_GLOPA
MQTKELSEILPQPLEAQLYAALSSNKLNIEQKLAAVENAMSELPFGVLDRLFFVGVPIVDAEVRERFRRLWYDRPYWSSDAGEEEGIGLKMQNKNNVDSPMLLNLPVPSSSAQQDPLGRASIFYQHQLPSSQPIIPPLLPPKHYNVAAPPLETWRRGLCPQCNGMPDAMTSLSNMVSPTAMPKAQLPAAVGVDHDQHQKQTTEFMEQQQPSMEKKPAVKHGGISIRVPTFILESNGSAPPTADGENDVILPDVPDIGEANANLSLNQSAEKANGIKVPADSVEARNRSKMGKRELISAEQQHLDLDADDGKRMIVRHKKRRSDNFHGRLQMRHVNRLLGILQKQKFVR